MEMNGPCLNSVTAGHLALATINMVQVVLLAFLAQRRISADRRDNGRSTPKQSQSLIDGPRHAKHGPSSKDVDRHS